MANSNHCRKNHKVSLINRPIVLLIVGYKKFLSPILPSVCRFEPSCSVYARECFEHCGFWRAFRLTVWRLLRCHPWHPGGYDPAPEK